MKNILLCLSVLFSSFAFSQETAPEINFSKSYFDIKNSFYEPESFFSTASLSKKTGIFQNDYSSLVPTIKIEEPKMLIVHDNFTGKYDLYNISGTQFNVIQSYSHFFEFRSVCNLDIPNTKTTFADLGGHVLNSYISQIKFKIKEGCK